MCAEVIEHLLEPDKAINEFERLLKPNGIFIVTVPNALAVSSSFLHNIKVLVSMVSKKVIGKRVANIVFSPDDLYSITPTLYKHRDYAPFELRNLLPQNFRILKNTTIVSPFYYKIIKKNEDSNHWLLKLIEHLPFFNMMGSYSLIIAQKLS